MWVCRLHPFRGIGCPQRHGLERVPARPLLEGPGPLWTRTAPPAEAQRPPGEAATWDSLAYIQHHLGDYRQAVDGYRQAVDIRRSLGNRSQQAASLSALADTHLAAGDRARARRAWHDALTILDELGHPDAGRIRANLDRYAGPAT